MVLNSRFALVILASSLATGAATAAPDTFQVQVAPALPATGSGIRGLPIPESAVGLTHFSAGGVTVTVGSDVAGGGIVEGSSNIYSAPKTGPATSYAKPYLSTELGTITVTFATPLAYLGLLWGTIDATGEMGPNQITFLRDGATVGTVTGDDVYAAAASPLVYNSSAYTMINDLSGKFDSVQFSSGTVSFEAAAFQVSTKNVFVPEPASLALLGTLLASGSLARRRRLMPR